MLRVWVCVGVQVGEWVYVQVFGHADLVEKSRHIYIYIYILYIYVYIVTCRKLHVCASVCVQNNRCGVFKF